MQWGDEEHQRLFKLIYEDTGTYHPAYLNKPALRDDCIKYLDAFRLLSASRLWSEVGPQPIQVSAISAYLSMVGIEDISTKLKYLRLFRIMDVVVIDHITEQRKKART